MKRLTMVMDVSSITGYGDHGQRIVEDLTKAENCHISIRAISVSEPFGARIPTAIKQRFVNQVQPEEWELVLKTPDFLPTQGKKTAYFTLWESTRLPKQSVEILKRAELIITSCAWCASVFSSCGIDLPIRVVPLGVDDKVFSFKPHDIFRTDDTVVFGVAGRMKHGGVRKGINESISAFLKAFPSEKDVKLKVKCHPDCDVDHIDDPRIELVQAHLSEVEIAEWLKSLDCFVSSARGEAWSLWCHQSLAVGRPVICSRFGGLSEFVTPQNSYCADYKMVPAEGFYEGLGHWALPDEDHIISLMRDVYEKPGGAAAKGLHGMRDVAGLTWENSNKKLADVLKEFEVI